MSDPLPVLPESIEELDAMIARWRDAAKAVEGMASGISEMAKLYLHGLETARKIICNWSQANPAIMVFDEESMFFASKLPTSKEGFKITLAPGFGITHSNHFLNGTTTLTIKKLPK